MTMLTPAWIKRQAVLWCCAVRFDPCALSFLVGSDTFLKELQVLHELLPTLFFRAKHPVSLNIHGTFVKSLGQVKENKLC